MNEKDFTDRLLELIESDHDYAAAFDHQIRRVRTYEEVGMLTSNDGLVVELENGDEFQITIVAS
jgi:hypothetical protein